MPERNVSRTELATGYAFFLAALGLTLTVGGAARADALLLWGGSALGLTGTVWAALTDLRRGLRRRRPLDRTR